MLGRIWTAAAKGIGLALFAGLFLVFLIQITARFGFNRPMAWTDELAVILYLWSIIWAAAYLVPQQDHVAFDLLTNLLPERLRVAVTQLGTLLVGLLAAWALPASWDYVRFMAREGTPVLGLPFMAVFFPLLLLLLTLMWRGLLAGLSLCRRRPSH